MLKGSRGISKDFVNKSILEKIWASLPVKTLELKIMANPPTVTVNATATLSGQDFPSITSPSISTRALNLDFFTFLKGGAIQVASTATALFSKHVSAKHVTRSSSPTKGCNSYSVIFDFMGSSLDIKTCAYYTTGRVFIKVNGEYTSATPYDFPYDSAQKYINVSFPSSEKRKIEVIFNGSALFGGVIIGSNDTILRVAEPTSPRVIILGDSFVEGAGATNNSALNSCASFFGDYIGWDDVWLSGLSGTGYLNDSSGTKYTYRQRIDTDVVPYSPDIIVVTGGANDVGYSQSDVYNEAKLLYQEIRSKSPDALLIVLGAFAWDGAEGLYASGIISVNNAIKQAAQETTGVLFIDVIESELKETAISGTLHAETSTNATAFLSQTLFPVGATVEIDGQDAARVIRCVIRTISGTSAPYTYGVTTTGQYHPAGRSLVQKGSCFWTGTGKVGTPTGYGNCDLFVSVDGQHPSNDGHKAIGALCAENIIRTLKNI